jgi:Patatin-like phospholipase
MGPLSIEQVLAEEAVALGAPGNGAEIKNLYQIAAQHFQLSRLYNASDVRAGAYVSPSEAERRKIFYRGLNKLNRSALCLSGGGIRSATFCLGVIQALAAYDVSMPASDLNGGCPERPENSLLGRFHYLSTVSGGGYVGSWLSSWRSYEDFSKVMRELTSRPAGPDIEPSEISWLRAYSNYLIPRIDGAATSAIYLRYLLANWIVIVPFLCLVLLLQKLLAATSVGIARGADDWLVVSIGVISVVCMVKAQAFTTKNRPTRREFQPRPIEGDEPVASPNNIRQVDFIRHDLAWSVISAVGFTIFFCSRSWLTWVEGSSRDILVSLAIFGALLFALGWIFGWPARRSGRDFALWVASGFVYGALVGLGVYLLSLFLGPDPSGWNLTLGARA